MFTEFALAKLIERNNPNRKVPMDRMSGIVVNVKQLQRWCEDCICSIDCQCNSCVYGCLRSVDCPCCFCLDDCLREVNKGENQVEVREPMVGVAEQKDKSSEGVRLTEKFNEWNECVQIEAEMKIIMTTVKVEIAGKTIVYLLTNDLNLPYIGEISLFGGRIPRIAVVKKKWKGKKLGVASYLFDKMSERNHVQAVHVFMRIKSEFSVVLVEKGLFAPVWDPGICCGDVQALSLIVEKHKFSLDDPHEQIMKLITGVASDPGVNWNHHGIIMVLSIENIILLRSNFSGLPEDNAPVIVVATQEGMGHFSFAYVVGWTELALKKGLSETIISHSPGGMVFNWLHQLKALHNRIANCCWCLTFFISIVLFFVHFLDYGRTYNPYGSEIVMEWNERQFIGVLDVYWRKNKSDVSELQYNFLVCSLLEWGIIVVVGLNSFQIDRVHKGLVRASAKVVKSKILKDIMEHNLLFIPSKSFFGFRGTHRNWKLQISSPFGAHCQSLIYYAMEENRNKNGKTSLVFDPGGLDYTITCLDVEVFSWSSSRQRSFHAENTRCLDTGITLVCSCFIGSQMVVNSSSELERVHSFRSHVLITYQWRILLKGLLHIFCVNTNHYSSKIVEGLLMHLYYKYGKVEDVYLLSRNLGMWNTVFIVSTQNYRTSLFDGTSGNYVLLLLIVKVNFWTEDFWKQGGWLKGGGTLYVGFLHIQSQLNILASLFLKNNSHRADILSFPGSYTHLSYYEMEGDVNRITLMATGDSSLFSLYSVDYTCTCLVSVEQNAKKRAKRQLMDWIDAYRGTFQPHELAWLHRGFKTSCIGIIDFLYLYQKRYNSLGQVHFSGRLQKSMIVSFNFGLLIIHIIGLACYSAAAFRRQMIITSREVVKCKSWLSTLSWSINDYKYQCASVVIGIAKVPRGASKARVRLQNETEPISLAFDGLTMQLNKASFQQLVYLCYCSGHWHFCGCSILPVAD